MKLSKKKLTMLRAKKQLSAIKLRAAGLNNGDMNAIYSGKSVRPETAGKIAEAFGVDVEEILEDVI